MMKVLLSLYVGLGFFYISASHSYFCKYFHNKEKEFGFPFIHYGRLELDYKYGYFGSLLLGIMSFSLFLNFFQYFFENFPNTVVGPEIGWFGIFFLLSTLLIFIISPWISGGAAIKWLLEGSLILFTLLLILSIPEDVTTFGQVQFVFSVSGAVLAFAYLSWLNWWVFDDSVLKAETLREAIEGNTDDVWNMWSTVVYFVFSSCYLLIGYLFMFVQLNT